ncbi:hypothetical protein D9757_001147 [Collybiopsis confluens]|uniref:Aminoglycoside phosphotransferase domain-containing protein n=1 Tax=Collybiopsis confluens TaxID=2823264 RepID=A0A8H5MGB6_9AGAR|nr:hypothetical protein D9757_001147 [Collybiopsis confluens]
MKLDVLLQKINMINFAQQATELRPEFTVKVDIPPDKSNLRRGGMNAHILVSDGLKRLARVRQTSTASTPVIIQSEIETMCLLKAEGMQVPNAFVPKSRHNEDLHYFFIEYLEGHPCSAPISKSSLTEDPCHRISDRLLFGGEIRGLISPDFLQDTPPFFFGPFQSSAHRYLAQMDHVLKHYEQSDQFSDAGISTYVAHLWLRGLIQDTDIGSDGPTFLKHADDKGDQIIIGTDAKLVGLVDWEWASTASKGEAFAAPLAPVHIDSFFSCSNDLSSNEEKLLRTFADLAECVLKGKVYQRLPMLIGQEPDLAQIHACEHGLTGKRGTGPTIDEWVERLIKHRYKDVSVLQKGIGTRIRNECDCS